MPSMSPKSGTDGVHCCSDVGCEAGYRVLPGAQGLDAHPGAVVVPEPVDGFVEGFGGGQLTDSVVIFGA